MGTGRHNLRSQPATDKCRSQVASARRPPMKRPILMTAACVAFAMPALTFGPSLAPQTPPAAFEVASVKPNKTGDGRVMLGLQPGRLNATNVPLRMLLRQALNAQDFQ